MLGVERWMLGVHFSFQLAYNLPQNIAVSVLTTKNAKSTKNVSNITNFSVFFAFFVVKTGLSSNVIPVFLRGEAARLAFSFQLFHVSCIAIDFLPGFCDAFPP